jgi:hypothetical protein
VKTLIKTAAAGALLAVSMSTLAAKPTSIVFDSNATTTDGTAFSNYYVKCSNGKQEPLTAWDNRKKWCVGKESADDCQRKQIKAAKQACKSG